VRRPSLIAAVRKTITKEQMQEWVMKTAPENWPTLDEWPDTDASDFEEIARENAEAEEEY
jgi:hypothetical protein